MKKVFSSVAVAAMLFSGASAYAQEGSAVQGTYQSPPPGLDVHFGFPGTRGVNELLIKKGIVTKEELEAQDKLHSLNISGYIQFQGKVIQNEDSSPNDGFNIRRAKLAAFGNAYEHVKFKLEADFGRLSSPSVLDDAFIEDDHLPYFVGRVGQFKVPFSLEMLTSDTEILTIERSEVANQIAPERDRGIMFSGNLLAGLLNYSIGAFNGQLPTLPKTYAVGSYSNVGRNTTNDNDQLEAAVRLVIKPVKWAAIGVSGLTTSDGKGANAPTYTAGKISGYGTVDRTAYEVDIQIKNPKRGCSIQGEYMRQWAKGIKTADVTTTSDGFYLQIGHYLIPKHLEAVIKYEEYDSDKDVADKDDIRWTTVGLNFYIHGHDAKLMANYIFKDERQNSYNNDTFLTQLQLRF